MWFCISQSIKNAVHVVKTEYKDGQQCVRGAAQVGKVMPYISLPGGYGLSAGKEGVIWYTGDPYEILRSYSSSSAR